MAFIRIKTITKNGRQYFYRYRQHNVRVGKKVVSHMEYLGPVGGHRPGLACAERQAQQTAASQKATYGETGEERAAREKASQFSQETFLEVTAGEQTKSPEEGAGPKAT